jgi:hypothetical protein
LSLHEFWSYDSSTQIQKLTEFHHLCNLCHKIKHIGFWCHTADGQAKLKQEGLTRNDLITHFCTVNRCPENEFENHEQAAFALWENDLNSNGNKTLESMPNTSRNKNSFRRLLDLVSLAQKNHPT